ncbi:MAG: hypothetical protein MUO77_14040 [Anaerolineales bacterium]|nr:hypothetical protein [Anaerolineales bacterium]
MKEQLINQRLSMNGTGRALASLLFILILLISGCTGSAAPSLDSSAQAWVEYPYEGSILPMAPVVLVVYAADSAGISFIHIKINGQSLPAYAASPMTEDGSTRLVRIDYTWPSGGVLPEEGQYVVEAVGVNTAGASGGSGSTHFCIVTCAPSATSTPVQGDTPTPTPALGDTSTPLPFITLPPNVTVSPSPTLTLTPSTSGNVTVEFFADPPYVNAGNCSTLHWDVSGTDKVFLNGSSVYFRGMEQRCPCQTETNTLRVIKPDGTSQEFPVRIEAYGSCSAPITDTPQPPPPPSDTSGPTVNAIYAVWESCDIYGQADISDPSGVSWAEFWYNLNNQGWAWIKMNKSGGLWESQVGVSVTDGMSTPMGSMVFKVRTLDTLNNESWSGESTLNYTGCGGTQ